MGDIGNAEAFTWIQFLAAAILLTWGIPVLGAVAIVGGWIAVFCGRVTVLPFVRAVGFAVGVQMLLLGGLYEALWGPDPSVPLIWIAALFLWFGGGVTAHLLLRRDGRSRLLDGAAALRTRLWHVPLFAGIARQRRLHGDRERERPVRLAQRLLPWLLAAVLLLPGYVLPLPMLLLLGICWALHGISGIPSLRAIRLYGYTMGAILVLGVAGLVFLNAGIDPGSHETNYMAGLLFWFGGGWAADRRLRRGTPAGGTLPAVRGRAGGDARC